MHLLWFTDVLTNVMSQPCQTVAKRNPQPVQAMGARVYGGLPERSCRMPYIASIWRNTQSGPKKNTDAYSLVELSSLRSTIA